MEATFELVWFSSREHLQQFLEIRDSNPWYRALFGGSYRLPEGFPFLQIGAQRFPLVYISSGTLTIAKNCITFAAGNSRTALGQTRHNINASNGFSIDIALHPTFGRFRAPGSRSYYSIDWIELSLPERTFLLCAGASGPGMSGVNDGTDSLFTALSSWANGHSS
jgi:hypothetical protein